MSESSPPHNPLGQDPCDPQTHPAAMEPTQPPPPLPPETPEMPTLSDARAGLVDASAPSLPPAPSALGWYVGCMVCLLLRAGLLPSVNGL